MKIPQTPPDFVSIIDDLTQNGRYQIFLQFLANQNLATGRKYEHWDKLRYKKPPEDLTINEWWAVIKFSRVSSQRLINLFDKNNKPFRYALPDYVLKKLHEIDRDASGKIQFSEKVANQDTKDRYIQSSLIEEAITSSQLEGAATTREVAKEMIRTGRRPISESEQMILNNFKAMKHVGKLKGEKITPKAIENLHNLLTDKILDSTKSPYRVPGDGIKVYDNQDNKVLHDPPDASEIPMRLKKLCEFANEKETDVFMHPVLKAILLHFWMAYDHPFKDGNGRTARALFYWYMLSQGYWLFEFVSISTILKKSPTKYARAFLYTETDDNDLTYFIIHQLDIIVKAIDSLHSYIQKKTEELKETEKLLKPSSELNYRQIALLGHALKHPGQDYTIESHRKSHGVTYQTSRTDLLNLYERGLLTKIKLSKAFIFQPSPNLSKKLKSQ